MHKASWAYFQLHHMKKVMHLVIRMAYLCLFLTITVFCSHVDGLLDSHGFEFASEIVETGAFEHQCLHRGKSNADVYTPYELKAHLRKLIEMSINFNNISIILKVIIHILLSEIGENTQLKVKQLMNDLGIVSPQNNVVGRSVTSNIEVPTVIPAVPFMVKADAEALYRAMTGFGTDEEAIINVLAHRTSHQRQLIRETYKQSFGSNLPEDLKSELSGEFKDVILALVTEMPLYLAQALHKALRGEHTNTLIEILCTRDKPSIENIKKSYKEEHGTELTADLNRSPVKFHQFLITMISEDRNNVTDDLQVARCLSQQLFDAGSGESGIPLEDELMRILTKFSYPMLRLAFREYFNIHNDQFENVIDTKFPEKLKDVMKNIYKAITSPSVFFAKELNSAIAGAGTDDPKLIRLIVSRCEIDMENIKEKYEKLYTETLEQAIVDDTSGEYRVVLLALIKR